MEEDPLIQAPASDTFLWRCDKDGCAYTTSAGSQPAPHDEHPGSRMRQVTDTSPDAPRT